MPDGSAAPLWIVLADRTTPARPGPIRENSAKIPNQEDRTMSLTMNRILVTRCLTALATLALLTASVRAQQKENEPKVEAGEFTSGGKTVAVEVSAPPKPGKYPALVLLHAVDGIEGEWAVLYRTLSKEYAS